MSNSSSVLTRGRPEIIDNEELVLVYPAGEGNHDEPEWVYHIGHVVSSLLLVTDCSPETY
jgi:hypothetical protein